MPGAVSTPDGRPLGQCPRQPCEADAAVPNARMTGPVSALAGTLGQRGQSARWPQGMWTSHRGALPLEQGA